MKKLFLDIGNSRIKWAMVDNERYEYLDAHPLNEFIQQMDELLFETIDQPDYVYFCSVGNAKTIEAIKSAIQTTWQLFAIKLESQQTCCGLENGYLDFHHLGADRWMAMQGAISLTKDPTIVIDAGTALTVDAIFNGQHLGGFIVPGIQTMRRSLSLQTAALDVYDRPSDQLQSLLDAGDNGASLLGHSTEEGILVGTLYMAASYLNQIVADLNQQMNTRFKVFLTGGDAQQLASMCDFDVHIYTDLVLRGMVAVEKSVKN